MDSDNLYPRSGAYRPMEPRNQQLLNQMENVQVVKALPLIQDIIKRFEERVSFYGSIDAVPEDVLTLPDEFMHLVAANKLTKSLLQAELEYLKELVEAHTS